MAESKGKEFPTIHAGGEVRILNCLPSDNAKMAKLSRPSAVDPISKIQPAFFRPSWLKIKNQGQYGACVGHGGARGVEFVRALAGQDEGVAGAWEELSAWDLYARLCNGIDSGANILDALNLLAKDGVALDATVPHGTINPRKITADAAALRPRFRLEVGGQLGSFEEMAWAAARGDGVVYSVHVGSGFNNLDAEGVPPAQRGFANHCVFAGGELVWSDKWGLMLGSDNSWDTTWGLKGRFRVCNALIQAQSYFEAFAVRAVVIDPEDQPPDPA